MSDRDFTFNGRDFKLSNIDALKQYHLVRRIAPILAEMLPSIKGSVPKDLKNPSQEETLKMISNFAGPVMNGLSKLSQADSEYVLFTLLEAVEMKQTAGNWAKVCANGMVMFSDLKLPVLLHAAGRAFMFNLSDFFSALPQ